MLQGWAFVLCEAVHMDSLLELDSSSDLKSDGSSTLASFQTWSL